MVRSAGGRVRRGQRSAERKSEGPGLVTLPARRQEVQTDKRQRLPSTIARTRWMFGFQRRLVRRWEWLTAIPNDGRFSQMSHTALTASSPPTGPRLIAR
jgi:hypothetical protein